MISRSEVERHRAMLEAKKTDLSFGRRSWEDIAIEKTADPRARYRLPSVPGVAATTLVGRCILHRLRGGA